MTHPRLFRSAVAAGVCAAVGTTAGIAASAAAPAHNQKAPGAGYGTEVRVPEPPPQGVTGAPARGGPAFKIGIGGPPVHAVEIVPNKADDGFETVTQDSGTVKSVSGSSLTITEGTGKATYATPTLTIPANATVERDFQSATLADIQPGDHVAVSVSSDGTTTVFATDPSYSPPKPPALPTPGAAPPSQLEGPGVAYGAAAP
jgi:hypothetical protein